MHRSDYLFNTHELRQVLLQRREELQQEINALQGDYLLTTNEDDLITYLVDKYRLEPPTLHSERATTAGTCDAQIDVSGDIRYGLFDHSQPHYVTGTSITISIPFSGDESLFWVQASMFTSNPPRGTVTNGNLELSFQQLHSEPEQLRQDYERKLRQIEELLQWVRNDIQTYNGHLPDLILNTLLQRKKKLLKDRNLEAALGIPLRRAQTPATTPIVKRKPPIRPAATTSAFVPEPELPDAEYDHILSVIENMVVVMERSPHAFSTMDEESLRNHILVQLNGHYEGQATGETFNFNGKTDILIRAEGRNAFVGECKFWSGQKHFLETIHQLLSYTTFRDTKTALIIFNKNKEQTSVLATIKECLPTHPLFKRNLDNRGESHGRTVFRHPKDPQRDIYVAVLTFHIPQP